MAKIGCKHLCFLESGGSAGIELAGLVEANLTITNAEGELYADNILWLSDSEFASGELSTTLADLTLEQEGTLFGATYDGTSTETLTAKTTDSAPNGTLGFVRSVVRRNSSGGGTKTYQAVIFGNVKASRGDESVSTKGSSIEYQTNPVTFKIMANSSDVWKTVTEHSTESAAISAVNTACSIS